MRSYAGLAVFVLLTGLTLCPAVASACSCEKPPTCGLHYADRDFVGLAISRRLEVAPASGPYDTFVYQIEVLESYSSDIHAGQIIEVRSGTGGEDCSFHFSVGETYLVDAWLADGKLWTGLCRRTSEVKYGIADVRELRRRQAGIRQPDLSGQTVGYKYLSEGSLLSGLRVTATAIATGEKRNATTDGEGKYAFDRLPKGYWQLTVDLPSNLRTTNYGSSLDPYGTSSPQLWIDSSNANFADCHADFLFEEAGVIEGSVSTPNSRKHTLSVVAFKLLPNGQRGGVVDDARIEDNRTFPGLYT